MELGIWTVWLVRAAWIATILLMVIGSIPISKLRLFHELMLIFAGRGKILQPSSSQKWTVPQKYFSHFYVVGVVWTTFLFAMTWMYALKMAPLTGGSHVEHWFKVWRAVFLLLLMEIHVLRRLIESFYVFNYSPCARMNILGYFTGLFLSLSINIAPEVVTFAGNQVAGFIAKGKSHTSSPDPLMKLGWCQMIGAVIFLWGWIHQRRCHAILGSLRKSPSQAKEYIIPHGDWFEMVLYVGLLLASGGTDVTIWLLFGFVVGNLTVAAGETHRWYLRKFENYPANRTPWIAVILLMVIASIPSSKLRLFHELVWSFTGRGKILLPSSSQKWTVPQKYFAHFYVFGVAWTTLLLAITWMYAFKMALLSSEEFMFSRHLTGGSHVESQFKVWRAVFLLFLMEIQVLRRLIESFYVFKYSPFARMNVLTYLGGLYPLMKLGWCQLVGGIIFLWGWLHQRRCHAILGSLRENPSQAKEYIIPHGDWFEIVSSPHYLAEIVLYVGLVIASGGTDITVWLLFGSVVGNLSLSAGETHRWYLRKFEHYPDNRNAIFPYILSQKIGEARGSRGQDDAYNETIESKCFRKDEDKNHPHEKLRLLSICPDKIFPKPNKSSSIHSVRTTYTVAKEEQTNLTPASPTIPMAIPAERPARPQARPEESK
ncbi:hypothetical protein HID58_011901 [Brassica napus]|uniref:3-oxo-5-alpha-steroid 4-dehydrogenase C-terminal domain-containing protein n=1 Tax=Brassica napus TaxID=3708 RepID=A0ABQ8DZK8_BRANA|nr:hypothetical protein HID58_011901 [Brassica napus]